MDQNDKFVYTAKAHTVGGRTHGISRSSDGLLDLRLSAPGSSRIGTNPEQLLAAAWSACFGSSIEIAARKMGLALPLKTNVEAEVSLKRGDDGYILSAHLHVGLGGLKANVAKDLVDEAHKICPFSKATRDKIDVVISMS